MASGRQAPWAGFVWRYRSTDGGLTWKLAAVPVPEADKNGFGTATEGVEAVPRS